MENQQIILEKVYNSPIEKIWSALTDEKQMRKWYFPMMPAFEPRVGFETQFNVHHNGKDFLHIWKVTEAEPEKKIAYEWKYGGYPGNSIVSFELKPAGGQTVLKLTFTVLESFREDENPELGMDNFHEGWNHFTSELQNFVEEK